MRTIRGRAGLLAAAIAVGLAVVTLLVYSPPTKEVLLAGGSGPLVAKLETLLKAKEDLRLDQRVMHWLQVLNNCLAGESRVSALDTGPEPSLRVRVYPVVPLSRQCGLIRWVDHATPLHSIHRNFLSRQAEPLRDKGQQTGVQSPIEEFHLKIREHYLGRALSSFGADDKRGRQRFMQASLPPRSKWSPALLLKVFKDLAATTPKRLLANELWYSVREHVHAPRWFLLVCST